MNPKEFELRFFKPSRYLLFHRKPKKNNKLYITPNSGRTNEINLTYQMLLVLTIFDLVERTLTKKPPNAMETTAMFFLFETIDNINLFFGQSCKHLTTLTKLDLN